LPTGYRITLGNNELNGGDNFSSGQYSFTTYETIGTGTVDYTVSLFTTGSISGTYYLGDDLSVYFVPDSPLPLLRLSTRAGDVPTPEFRIIEGTSWDNSLFDTGDGTLIFGGTDASGTSTGNDTIYAYGGDDTIYSGDGWDRIEAGDGADFIDAGANDDIIYYGSGADTVYGGSGNDIIDDVAGYATAEASTIYAGDGQDIVYGTAGGDTIYAGAGPDSIYGELGDDELHFGESDFIYGGDGDDTFILDGIDDSGTNNAYIYGGEGSEVNGDTLVLGQFAQKSTLNITNSDDNSAGLSGTILLNDNSTLYFYEIENIICFAKGTKIATPRGARAIETLKVGDYVVTRDRGPQPIRWIQSRTVPGLDHIRPVQIRKGVLDGQNDDLLVSPQHRILFQGYKAELLFGESEVLVSARHLIDGVSVRQLPVESVTYVHMLFDHHEVITAQGVHTESFHPGDTSIEGITEKARHELFEIFPDLRSLPSSYGQTARRCLRAHEALLVV